tara:strand:- start:966 stop:1100 length:135 start_codon:yes stop_codon:yes gene_type:complete
MYINIEIIKAEQKDYFKFLINGLDLGTWERSDLRHLIETIDNKI